MDKFWMSFQLDNETKQKLEKIAKGQDRTMSASLRVMITEKYDALFIRVPAIPFTGHGDEIGKYLKK